MGGLGVFAAEHINKGEVVVSEKACLIIGTTHDKDIEMTLNGALETFFPEGIVAFDALPIHDGHPTNNEALTKFLENSYNLPTSADKLFKGLFLVSARINIGSKHNSLATYDESKKSIVIMALKDIKEGEEAIIKSKVAEAAAVTGAWGASIAKKFYHTMGAAPQPMSKSSSDNEAARLKEAGIGEADVFTEAQIKEIVNRLCTGLTIAPQTLAEDSFGLEYDGDLGKDSDEGSLNLGDSDDEEEQEVSVFRIDGDIGDDDIYDA